MFDQRINTFLTVCDNMSYTKAAEKLFITQPAVTQHVKYLEKRYKTSFFTYSNRQLNLTKSGMEFKRYLQEGKAREKLMSEKLKEIDQGLKKLRLGATLTIGEFTIAPFIRDFHKKFDDYRISIQVDNTRILMKEIDSGSIHFGLIEGLFNKSAYDSRLLILKEFVLVVSPESDLARKREVQLADLLEETLIIREKGSGSREVLERGLAERNYSLDDFREVIRIGNVNLMKKMVRDGLGISFMYEDAVQDEINEGSLVRVHISNFNILREFNFVSIKDSPFPEDLDVFYKYFKEKIAG
ncbi:LysR family transcriptional regulator [Gudongella sp. DL1XJH-153]|uniref:LysR family transcriptional regulator n=1 Tax=Gudongella sp. DL1XJH-153 TaxID=3409804 RepID=UPI003BB67365